MSETYLDPPSTRALIEALDVGETFARARRFDPDESSKNSPIEALRSMRLSMQGIVHNVMERTGNVFTIESGEFRTRSRDIMAVLCVTRKQ